MHRADCINIKHSNETQRLIEVNWIDDCGPKEKFSAEIQIKAVDRQKLLTDVSTVIGNEGISMSGLSCKTLKDGTALMNIDIVIKNTKQVDQLIGKIAMIPNVLCVYRI